MKTLSTFGVMLLLATAAQAASPFTIVALPDTQFYSQTYPSIFTAQTQWIVNNQAAQNFVFVTHLGDVVNDSDQSYEWANANTAMNILHTPGTVSPIPYSVSAGNHDMANDGGANYANFYGSARYAGNSWYGGSSPDQISSFQTFSADGYDFLHINLGADGSANTPAAAMTWAQGVLSAHPGVPTIITNHNYMGTTGRLANGDTVWNGLINNNPQVFMVVNGHTAGEGQQISTDASGKKVIEMLSDYQDRTNGGDGWLREITFNPDAGQIQVRTYSPTLNRYETDANSQFAYNVTFGANKQITVTGLAAAPPPPDPTGPTTLKGWWKLNETSGTTAADSSPGWSRSWNPPAPAPVLDNGKLVGAKAQFVPGAGREGGAILLTNTAGGQGYIQLTGGTTGNAAANLGVQTFTLAAWVKRTGAGASATSGSGGVTAIPIFAKGVGESDNNSNVDADFFLGIDPTTNKLCADFETYSKTTPGNPNNANYGGTNYPVFGSSNHTIPVDSTWHHVAVSWDGQFWRLYVDGQLDQWQDWSATFSSPVPPVFPRYDSIQNAAIGAALSSTGVATGGFYGYIDDVRLYDGALSGTDIAALVAVPEPATMCLLALGGLATLRKRRRNVAA